MACRYTLLCVVSHNAFAVCRFCIIRVRTAVLVDSSNTRTRFMFFCSQIKYLVVCMVSQLIEVYLDNAVVYYK